MALMVAPGAACANLQRLAARGLAGRYGFYEAIDYTASRLPRGQTSARRALVHGAPPGHEPARRSRYLLLDRPMQRRFDADPRLQATELLLQERVPRGAPRSIPHVAEQRRPARRGRGGEDVDPARLHDPEHGRRRRCSCSPTAATT